jgi:hypothetical protein
VKAARLLVARARTDPPDVLHFGASESLFVSPSDTDRRPLPKIIADDLGPDVSVYSVAGPGYHPRMMQQYIRLFASVPKRPVVVIGVAWRLGLTPWALHPVYSYPRPLQRLSRISPSRPTWAFRAIVKGATDEEMAEHDRRPFSTLAGELTVGDYRLPLKDPAAAGLDDESALRLLYAYHHAALLPTDDPWLHALTNLGRQLRELGFGVVAYQIPVPIQEGERLHGEPFRERVVANLAAGDAAFRAGAGAETEIVPTGAFLETADYLDPRDGTEHMNISGRLKMAELITPAIQRELSRRADPGRGGR